MSTDDKVRALELVREEIIELKQELQNEYSRVVKEAISEALNRYQAEEEWLKNEVDEKSSC